MRGRFARRWLDRVSFLGITGIVFGFGAIGGLQVLVFRLDVVYAVFVVGMLDATMTALSFSLFMGVSGLVLLAQLLASRQSDPPEPTDDRVTAIVPVYQDANVLHVSVESLLASTQPVDVLIVCEPDDPRSITRANELAEHDRVDYLVNSRYSGSKAGAINYALEEVETEYVGVFDADECVDPNFAAAAVEKLTDYDIVQGRTLPRGSGLIETLAYCETVLLDDAGRRLLYVFTGFRSAASRALIARRDAMISVGGYDPAMVTEDFEFMFRCYNNHVSVHEELRYPSTIDAAHTIQDWWGQRKRWMTGYAQVFARQLRSARRPTGYRDVFSTAITGMTVVGSLLLLSMIPKFVLLFVLDASSVVLVPAVAITSVVGLIRFVDVKRGRLDGFGFWWMLVPALLPLYGLAVAKAIPEYLFSWDGDWYHAEKHPE